ncbi:MAG: SMP-30/gluconolactonase/LRE family protein [Gammaproteobacteria bacterium]|nr:SMP-30/gluconolactonase/LRE family protein [Gammaproteobacteria bacterium]MBU2056871.1 SMP-30/gluconolactonase/LRE family protein [Gammaproteobacteria bacterium]MBU2174597.1 SMP-30/gluconolactonase/LRE family protein [Gammaproteobacteria bacterium]MBU2248290.1 SMP-30/gluconolactonase/LRE family protein [Gammaproteobacteria bacterium]MBU2343706.1 SMP-30/gluconolactonase/LRE family protein [Gammaproteobacteria bacterium]
MKTLLPFMLSLTLPMLVSPLVVAAETATAKPALEALWQTDGLRVPESVLWVQQQNNGKTDNLLFVSEIDGKSNEADAVGGIALLNTDGSIRNKDWLRGLNAPKGLAVYQGKLYIADLTEVVIVDIASAKILNKIKAPDSVFLNDVAVDSKGVVYISDTRINRIYKLEQDKISVFLDNVEAANGLTLVADQLYIGAGDKLLKTDLTANNKTPVQVAIGFAARADGVEAVGNGDFIVSCWAGLVYYVYADGRIQELLDTRAAKLNTADIGWDATTKTLYIPTFFGNSVQAYSVKLK